MKKKEWGKKGRLQGEEGGSFGHHKRAGPKTRDYGDDEDEVELESVGLRKLLASVWAAEKAAIAEVAPPEQKTFRQWWSEASPAEKRYFILKWSIIITVICWLVVVNTLLKDAYDEVQRIREINKTRKDDRFENKAHVSKGDATETALIAAICGWIFGPYLVLYGYQIMALIVVINAFAASGLQGYVTKVQQVEVLNADSAAGRMLPTQLTDLQQVLVSAFTISATALKIPPFDAAMKAAIVVGIMVATVLDQIPPLFGCVCENGEVPCSTVYKHGLYLTENKCFWDRWFRFLVHYSFVLPLAIKAMHNPQRTRNMNVAVLAASFMCSAIFDTVLAVLPAYGSRVQPYRMGGMLLFGFGSHKIHCWMRYFDYEREGFTAERIDADRTAVRPTHMLRMPLLLIHTVGLIVMMPLRRLDRFCNQLRLFGQQNMIFDEIERLGLVEHRTVVEITGVAKDQSKLRVDIKHAQFNDKLSRNLVSAVNCILACMSLAVVGMAAQAIRSGAAVNVMRNGRLFIEIVLVGASIVAFVALLGWCGSEYRLKKFLVPYSLIIIACFVLQLVVAAFVYDYNTAILEAVQAGLGEGHRNVSVRVYNGTVLGRDVDLGLDVELSANLDIDNIGRQWSAFKADSLEYVRLEMAHLHGEAQCSFQQPTVPARIACQRATWYSSFVNDRCQYYNSSDVLFLQGQVDTAMANEHWALASRRFETLHRVRRISQGISACLAKHEIDTSRGVTEATPTSTFCSCRSAIADRITEVSRPLANATIALAIVELLALVCVGIVMKNGDKIAKLKRKLKRVDQELAELNEEARLEQDKEAVSAGVVLGAVSQAGVGAAAAVAKVGLGAATALNTVAPVAKSRKGGQRTVI